MSRIFLISAESVADILVAYAALRSYPDFTNKVLRILVDKTTLWPLFKDGIQLSQGWRAGFELTIHNLQFAKRFGSLRMSFCIFSKNCESLGSDTSRIFRVFYWTSYIVIYFKPIKYPLFNNNVISKKFIVHINFKLHTTFFCNYYFVTIQQIISS